MSPVEGRAAPEGRHGMTATELGSAVHDVLERIDLASPTAPDAAALRERYPDASSEDLARIAAFVSSYCRSELASRVAAMAGAGTERPFAFEHDGVLLHGFLDVLHRDGDRAFVLDYKTNSLEEGTPEEIVEADYRLQRLVYALACFRAGADEVEVAYHFLERPDAVVTQTFTRDQQAELEAGLSAAIATINEGVFRPTPSEFVCVDCPALDVVCAGPRLRGLPAPQITAAAATI